MRLDFLLDPLYVLGSLWSVLTQSQVCVTSPYASADLVPEIVQPLTLPARVIAFLNVNVVPMDTERVLVNQTVVVEDGRITALGPVSQVTVPAGAVRVDGRGQYLIPGLADMHAHVPVAPGPFPSDTERHLFSYLAHGVTTVRQIYTLDWAVKKLLHFETSVVSPRLYLGVPAGGLVLKSLDSVAAQVSAAKAAGYDFLDIPAGYPREARLFDSLLATARRLGLPTSSHTNAESVEDLPAFGAHGGSVEHLYAFEDLLRRPDADVSAAELQAVAAKVQRAGAWITVTLDCVEYNGRPSGNIELARRIVKALQDAGVGLLLGSDVNGGVGGSASIVHTELASLVRAGLTPYQALVTGTRNVAQYFGMLDSAGTVAVGKRADLVLLNGNPLQDIRHTREPAGVMLGGRWFDRAALDRDLLASPKFWLQAEVRGGLMPRIVVEQAGYGSRLPPSPAQEDQGKKIEEHFGKVRALTDSLAVVQPKSAEHERMLRVLVEELGAMRALLTPEQHVAFDPAVRVWLREQARQGHPLVVPGVAPMP
jgi:imidazolonepropionase-like amidohydrolase